MKKISKYSLETSTSISPQSNTFFNPYINRVLYSKSVGVDELIRCGVANYLEFQNVT